MRIVMLAGSLSRRAGGLHWSVRHLSQTLQKAGAEVHVIGLRDADTDRDHAVWQPLDPIVLDPVGPAQLGYAADLDQEIAKISPDIIHLHGIWQLMSRSTSRFADRGTPVMISPRGMLDPWAMAHSRWKKRLAWHAFERKNLHRSSCLHALNPSEAASIRAVLPKAAIATIPNGMDMPDEPLGTARSEPPEGRPKMLFVSRIHPKKGLIEFLDQWAAVLPRLSRPWVLRISGPDEVGHLPALKERVAALGLGDRVEFIGPIYGEQKAQELSQASAFVLPSKSEGLPMAILEAWATGLPVFMTRACNLPEGFEAGAAVELTDDPELLFSGLEKTDLVAMGNRGRALVAERFSWDNISGTHLAVYDWMLQKRPQDCCPSAVTWK